MFRTLAVAATFVAGAALSLAFGAGTALAHHAFAAEFDASKPVKFEKAVVKKMEWVNPHVWIHIEVPLADGKAEPWAIEAGTPNVLFRRGFTKEDLLPGTVMFFVGYRAM
jgi:hypothetical protein